MPTCEKTGDWWWIAQFVLMWFNGGLGVMHWNTISRNATCWKEPKCLASVWKLFSVLWELLFLRDAEAWDQFSRFNMSDTILSNYEPINRDKRIHFPSYLSFPFLFKMLIWLWMFQHRTPQRTQTSNVMTTTSHFFNEGLITTCGCHLLVIIWWGMRFPLLELHPQTDIIASHGVVEGH